MVNKKNIVIGIIIIIIIGVAFSIIYQPATQQDINTAERDESLEEQLPDNQFKELKLVLYNQDASMSWKLITSVVQNYNSQGSLQFSPVQIKAYDQTGNESYLIKADSGIYDSKKEELALQGSVEIDRGEQKITAGQLSWQKEQDILMGNQGIVIESPDYIMRGESFKSNSRFSELIVNGDDNEQAYIVWKGEDR